MKPPDYRLVNPRDLRLPAGMSNGADPAKLQRQIAKFGKTMINMPPLWVHESPDGFLVIMDGVTRATRIAKLLPGAMIVVEVTDQTPRLLASALTVGDRLP